MTIAPDSDSTLDSGDSGATLGSVSGAASDVAGGGTGGVSGSTGAVGATMGASTGKGVSVIISGAAKLRTLSAYLSIKKVSSHCEFPVVSFINQIMASLNGAVPV